jgi:hypothetical protein
MTTSPIRVDQGAHAAPGYAVVDEVIKDLLLDRWLGLLEEQVGDPITGLQ